MYCELRFFDYEDKDEDDDDDEDDLFALDPKFTVRFMKSDTRNLTPETCSFLTPETCLYPWNADDPKLWEEHGWVPYDAIKQTQAIYTGKGIDPQQAYDLKVAKEIIREEKQS